MRTYLCLKLPGTRSANCGPLPRFVVRAGGEIQNWKIETRREFQASIFEFRFLQGGLNGGGDSSWNLVNHLRTALGKEGISSALRSWYSAGITM